jgi:hypothetical protein
MAGTRFKDIFPPEYLQQAQELEKERKRYLQAHEKAWARYAVFQQKISQALLDKANKEAESKRLAEEAERQRFLKEEGKRLAKEAELKRLAEEEIKGLAKAAEHKEFVKEIVAGIKNSKQFMEQEAERQRLALEAERKRLAEEAERKRLLEKKPIEKKPPEKKPAVKMPYVPKFIVKKDKK